MKRVGQPKRRNNTSTSATLLASTVPSFKVNYRAGEAWLFQMLKSCLLQLKGGAAAQSESHYVSETSSSVIRKVPPPPDSNMLLAMPSEEDTSLPSPDSMPTIDENVGAVPVYEDTLACDENGAKTRQCWLDKHRTTPTHWPLIWNADNKFFEKHDFCRVMKSTAVAIGHDGHRCPEADPMRLFTLVDSNGIHATCHGEPEFQQLLRAGIFPGSVKEPKTGYALGLLEYYRQERSQGKGSASNFVLVLQRLADPFFAGQVPDIYHNFLAITRWHAHLDIILRCGQANGVENPLPGETDRPYPHRPLGYLGLNCAACPEHLISNNNTLDGNFKMNMFYKHNNGSDDALTDGRMYFPKQTEYDDIAAKIVVKDEDKASRFITSDCLIADIVQEVPCNAHIRAIRHQGSVKYGNTAISGVIACACDHTVAGSFIDMKKGEAFGLGTYAQREHLRHTNSPPHGEESETPTVWSYDSFCSFVVNLLERAIALFPDEKWLQTLLKQSEGQIPADHIRNHGPGCQEIWQAVYFACRAHFHGESAEMLWAFLNALGSSTRQMTAGARHDIINFVVDAWNTRKVLRQAELCAEERLTALHLFELHMAVVEDLSKQNATEVVGWSQLPRVSSVYQHESKSVMTIENMLASMMAEEDDKATREKGYEARTSIAQWIRDGMFIERDQQFIIALVVYHREHPLQETWTTIMQQRKTLNTDLKKFRNRQRDIYPRLTLSGLDVDEPELTAIQLPSYRIKHGQRLATSVGATEFDSKLRDAEIKLRCREAENGILAVQATSLALSAVKKARDLDYRGQAGTTRSQRNLQKAEMMKTFEIAMYNRARAALVTLGHLDSDSVGPYPPLSARDTRQKETNLHRAKGDSRLFDGTAWYLQSGEKISGAPVSLTLGPQGLGSDDDEPRLLAGTQSLKRLASGLTKSPRKRKRIEDILPDNVVVEEPLSEAEDSDPENAVEDEATAGIKADEEEERRWKATTRSSGNDGKLAEYKRESVKVQWFRAQAEMYRWLEQYERKHAELMRVIARYRRDSIVWKGLGDREETHNGEINSAATFAWMQGTMYHRLKHNAKIIFKDTKSGTHHDWVTATTFDELVIKIDVWRDAVFTWMDEMCTNRITLVLCGTVDPHNSSTMLDYRRPRHWSCAGHSSSGNRTRVLTKGGGWPTGTWVGHPADEPELELCTAHSRSDLVWTTRSGDTLLQFHGRWAMPHFLIHDNEFMEKASEDIYKMECTMNDVRTAEENAQTKFNSFKTEAIDTAEMRAKTAIGASEQKKRKLQAERKALLNKGPLPSAAHNLDQTETQRTTSPTNEPRRARTSHDHCAVEETSCGVCKEKEHAEAIALIQKRIDEIIDLQTERKHLETQVRGVTELNHITKYAVSLSSEKKPRDTLEFLRRTDITPERGSWRSSEMAEIARDYHNDLQMQGLLVDETARKNAMAAALGSLPPPRWGADMSALAKKLTEEDVREAVKDAAAARANTNPGSWLKGIKRTRATMLGSTRCLVKTPSQ
ncbi:hypothetical protein B0H12DRAFT_1078252 [Mycena haematopus]|nr:hypothetical protein B0H12DRAFT_1078252 [Mycena haematopus]